jgi:predicted phosphodiesterase
MKARIFSDLHLEFGWDMQEIPEGEVAIVAGDICYSKQAHEVFGTLSQKYEKVLFVLGNHDYYTNDPRRVEETIESLGATYPNLHWLHHSRQPIIVGQTKVVGTTLWFPKDPDNVIYASRLNDFHQIGGFHKWVYEENAVAQAYLQYHVSEGCVVVTHHLPTYASVSQEMQGDCLNRFYVCPMDKLIGSRSPKYWIHGHTHVSLNRVVGDTQLICNPKGYVRSPNPEFSWDVTIDL